LSNFEFDDRVSRDSGGIDTGFTGSHQFACSRLIQCRPARSSFGTDGSAGLADCAIPMTAGLA
jgi:hypothetical protein